MREKNPPYIRRAALALGLLLAPPVADAMDAIVHAVGSLVSADLSKFGFISPALAQPATLTKAQSDALAAYDNALSHFKSILAQRRAQIDAKQPLPNLPGQALYLARNGVMSAYKDLTDALPSKIGRPNRLGIPPAYFNAGLEPLLDEYVKLFEVMQAPPANAQKSETPFKDVVDLEGRLRGQKASARRMPTRRAASAWGCSLPRPTATRPSEMRARTNTREACKPARPKIKSAAGSGRRSSHRSQPLIPR